MSGCEATKLAKTGIPCEASRVDRVRDLLILDLDAGRLQGVDHALGALAAAGLTEQSPDERGVAGFEAAGLHRAGAERLARGVQLAPI